MDEPPGVVVSGGGVASVTAARGGITEPVSRSRMDPSASCTSAMVVPGEQNCESRGDQRKPRGRGDVRAKK